MDAAVNAAISAVHIDDDATVQRWFEFVCATYEQHAGSDQVTWSQLASALAEGAIVAGVDGQLVERFVEHLNANDAAPLETVGRMAQVATELPTLFRQLTAENAGGGYDESAWHAFLPEHGVRWDGTEASWEQFKAWFLYEAEQRGLQAPATGFITHVEGQPDKVAAFAEYGVTISGPAATEDAQAPDVSSFPEVKPGDSGEWVEYLDAMLTSHGF